MNTAALQAIQYILNTRYFMYLLQMLVDISFICRSISAYATRKWFLASVDPKMSLENIISIAIIIILYKNL